MIYCIMVFSSVTYALKAQGVLSKEGIGTRLEKLNKNQTLKGCGYGLRIERSKLSEATRIMKREKIRVVEVIDY